MRTQKLLPYLAIIFVNIVWGLSFIASKYALGGGFSPFTLAFARFLLSSALLLPVCLIREGRPRFTRREWLMVLLSALAGITLYFLFEYKGLQYTTASNASLILAVIPVMTMLSSILLRGARYKGRVWLGMLGSLVGVALVVRYGGVQGAPNPLLGNLLLVFACVCWVAFIELTSGLLARHSNLKLTTYQSLMGALTLLPLCLLERPDLSLIGPGGWAAAIFLGVVCSAVCYILYAYAMRRLNPLRTSLFINLNPIAAVIGGVVLLNETISLEQIIGGALILLSIYFVNRAHSVVSRN